MSIQRVSHLVKKNLIGKLELNQKRFCTAARKYTKSKILMHVSIRRLFMFFTFRPNNCEPFYYLLGTKCMINIVA